MVVNVGPAAVTPAPPERVWRVLTTPERLSEWNDATFVSSDPPGPVKPGQTLHFTAPSFGRTWPVTMEVRDTDPQSRCIDIIVRLPLGVVKHEHISLTETNKCRSAGRCN